MSVSCFRPDVLAGRVAFVTGGSSGINKAIARRYLEHGASVFIVARDQARLDAAIGELAAVVPEGTARVGGHSADVRDLAAVTAAAEAGAARFGRYDMVVAGAAGNFLGAAEKLSSNAFGAVVDIDLKGTFHTFRACHAHLAPRARLIAISAPQAAMPMAFQAPACAAKAGVEMLVKSLAVEWGGLEGVRANAISPGLVAGTYGAEIFCKVAGEQALVAPQPVPRLATLEEVADVAVWLASPLTDYVTGQVIAIDGGLTLASALGGSFAAAAGPALQAAARRP